MGGPKEMTRNLREQEPGQDIRHEDAADNSNIARNKAKRHIASRSYRVTPSDGIAVSIVVSGRKRWTLEELRKAGATGCTPKDNPAPRWSSYVHELRGLGVDIETIHEPHEGDFPGTHGRYVLRSTVEPIGKEGGSNGETV